MTMSSAIQADLPILLPDLQDNKNYHLTAHRFKKPGCFPNIPAFLCACYKQILPYRFYFIKISTQEKLCFFVVFLKALTHHKKVRHRYDIKNTIPIRIKVPKPLRF